MLEFRLDRTRAGKAGCPNDGRAGASVEGCFQDRIPLSTTGRNMSLQLRKIFTEGATRGMIAAGLRGGMVGMIISKGDPLWGIGGVVVGALLHDRVNPIPWCSPE